MHASRVGRRVATTVAGLLIAGAAGLAAAPANAASPAPGGHPASAAAQPAQGTARQEPRGKVVSRLTLSIRERATSNSRYLGGLQPGSIVHLYCKVRGQNVDGNDLWYKLGDGRPGYVAARYVQNLDAVPYCR
ncbi:SH3 domain-containing protein [Streptomyces fuscigenes]|uniref:SH3 domain-containing protein n=1 Tax=Streptomyces fuscigenes TaxID=1528880 RepID=UPI001F25B4C1|nr:SH3 domain-containing protein [Streptomyces fuscigenes]MCF3965095.1 SH3 domain-containing protein [Streptomyces fuscigenes]